MLLSKNIAVAILLVWLTLVPCHVNSAIQGEGKVRMHGAIIDTACAIKAGSQDQTIDMGTISLGRLTRHDDVGSKPFSIKLVNCILERSKNKINWNFFQVTFDGYAEGALFGVQGDARGIALKIKNSNGTQVMPGKPMPLEEIIIGNKVLNYSMTLTPNNKPLKVGSYSSTVRFKLDYF